VSKAGGSEAAAKASISGGCGLSWAEAGSDGSASTIPAASAAAQTEASHFSINVLQTGQQPASIRFSTRDEDRFGATRWACGEAGAPILEESLGVFECERFAVYDGGDHHILVGRVVKASFDASLDPLLYFRGRYRRLHFD
jgi:flavin reductase (DIM6/NTAB) family NADH-FMN oxidoreductase RutF